MTEIEPWSAEKVADQCYDEMDYPTVTEDVAVIAKHLRAAYRRGVEACVAAVEKMRDTAAEDPGNVPGMMFTDEVLAKLRALLAAGGEEAT